MEAEIAENLAKRRAALKSAITLSSLYIVIAGLWILLSDAVVDALFPAEQIRFIQTMKGWLFVAVSGVLIFLVSFKFNLALLRSRTLEHWVHYDSVTGVPNKRLFLALLDAAMEEAKAYEGSVGALVIRLNELEKLSQAIGMDISDSVAITVAERIRFCLRPNDRIARLDSCTFAVMMAEPCTADHAAVLGRAILSTLLQSIIVDDALEEIHIRPAVGVGFFPDNGGTPHRLLHTAEAAALKAGRKGGDTCLEFYTSHFSKAAADRVRLESRLKRAIETDAFEVHYQPQVDLHTLRIVGAEALIRWCDPDEGDISPGVFIPLAEETGQIGRITGFVIRQVIDMLNHMKSKGLTPVKIAVNISGKEIAGGDIERVIQKAVDQYGIDPRLLELEITETAAMDDPDATRHVLQVLRGIGIGVTLDDFATGYSSLTHLQRFKLDKLKIDKVFVQDIPDNQNNAAICKAIIAMARTLGLQVVAEGVETEAAVKALQGYGCDYAQGFLFSRAVSAAEFENLLQVNVDGTAGNIIRFPGDT